MTPTVVFETPGLIDLRSFTTLGVSAKPNSTQPIGQFGTGLKYAIAVLVREGAEPVVYIGRDKYTFSKKMAKFRDTEISLLRMKSEKWKLTQPRWTELPFTTEYGKFWKMWQVFRELEANTRDEKGTTYERGALEPVARSPERTYIEIRSPSFYEAFEKRDEIFLPGASALLKRDDILEVFNGPSSFLYFRGMRVYELSKPSRCTYNIVRHVELTEDRTLRWEFQARQALGDFVLKSENKDFIELVTTATDDDWESSVEYDSFYRTKPSPTYEAFVRSKPSGLRASAGQQVPDEDETTEPVVKHPHPWRVIGDWIEDANRKNVCQKPQGYPWDWTETAQRIVELLNDSV